MNRGTCEEGVRVVNPSEETPVLDSGAWFSFPGVMSRVVLGQAARGVLPWPMRHRGCWVWLEGIFLSSLALITGTSFGSHKDDSPVVVTEPSERIARCCT